MAMRAVALCENRLSVSYGFVVQELSSGLMQLHQYGPQCEVDTDHTILTCVNLPSSVKIHDVTAARLHQTVWHQADFQHFLQHAAVASSAQSPSNLRVDHLLPASAVW